MNESELLNLIRLEASRKGARLWRNNVGAVTTEDGRFIRFGLANDSRAINQVLKSSDLIGIKPVLITPEMIGKTLGQFLCREVKRPEWIYRDTIRERAQLNWITLIRKLGGDAAFAIEDDTI